MLNSSKELLELEEWKRDSVLRLLILKAKLFLSKMEESNKKDETN
jgi:hypothetical protein